MSSLRKSPQPWSVISVWTDQATRSQGLLPPLQTPMTGHKMFTNVPAGRLGLLQLRLLSERRDRPRMLGRHFTSASRSNVHPSPPRKTEKPSMTIHCSGHRRSFVGRAGSPWVIPRTSYLGGTSPKTTQRPAGSALQPTPAGRLFLSLS